MESNFPIWTQITIYSNRFGRDIYSRYSIKIWYINLTGIKYAKLIFSKLKLYIYIYGIRHGSQNILSSSTVFSQCIYLKSSIKLLANILLCVVVRS